MINISICVSDLPKDKIKTAVNGKKYIDLCLVERREVSKYGDTHAIYLPQSREERERGDLKQYVGKGVERYKEN